MTTAWFQQLNIAKLLAYPKDTLQLHAVCPIATMQASKQAPTALIAVVTSGNESYTLLTLPVYHEHGP